jgi:hypothetical protein
MYSTFFPIIQATLETVGAIKDIYAYPVEKVAKYPAAIYFPDTLDNQMHDTDRNEKVVKFKLYVVVGSAQKEKVDIFNTVLPKAVDAVLEAFDAAWDAGTIDGSRVRMLVNSGAWSMAPTPEGLEAQAELTVEFRLLTVI